MDVDNYLFRLKKNNEILTEKEVRNICNRAIEIISNESNLVPVKAPVNVCGDIHG